MPIGICGKCGKKVPDSYHEFDDPCRCIDWIKKYKRMGWTMNPYTKKVLEGKNET